MRKCDLPFGAPPILPRMKSQVQFYLENPQILPIHDLNLTQQHWKEEINIKKICHVDVAPTPTTLSVLPNADKDIVEILTPHAGMTNRTSMSLQRTPGPPQEWVRGNASNVPFWPGGMEWNPLLFPSLLESSDLLEELSFCKDLKTVPPGFMEGMNFGAEDINLTLASALKPGKAQIGATEDKNLASESIIDLADLLRGQGSVFDWMEEQSGKEVKEEPSPTLSKELVDVDIEEIPVVDISKATSLSEQKNLKSTEWAEIIDVNSIVQNFHQAVPNPAHAWPFELDNFQKHAIIHLEKGEDVFIAAHTSAGKTVIAEYAIALSQKHMTRAIYTSPIKALSNQKFRDFKTTFSDVGLLTGDVQINAKASCLIMTTEILRSMLYNGSDIIRDLEWVIFDEVHYINDSERGVVWEEVLILLPHHVNIVMLSATVPNTAEFATWVGRTKGRKMFVISTSKRPVPLEHYLYTGQSGRTKDERFLIVSSDGQFITKGYRDALEAKKAKEKDAKPSPAGPAGAASGSGRGRPTTSSSGGGGAPKGWGHAQDKNLLIALTDHLKKHDKLPVVIFTFSRHRCDLNASLLSSVDLVTAEEKGRIHQFFQKCISRLKGSDQKLPQVTVMQDLLKRGIGVHHSGILPILKEVVEMLFQEGCVKLLFATETFAMGVNVPVRTVVFDSIRKHDGTGFRNLLPAEYIQMAGRAGRRGLDTTGTVIILCKTEVPETSELHAMMMGQPMRLSSQFRVTYSMILNLLRVEHLRVEDMMKRSFGEDHQQSKVGQLKKKVQDLYDQVQHLPPLHCGVCQDIDSYYDNASSYLKLKQEMQELLLSHPNMSRELNPGRVLIVQHQDRCNKLGILLNIDARSKEKLYKVLILAEPVDTVKEESLCGYLYGISLMERGLFYPSLKVGHAVVSLKGKSIWEVTKIQLKVEVDKIIGDWENRQLPRFRDNPPGPSVSSAVQELSRLSQNSSVDIFDPLQDWKWKNMELVGRIADLAALKSRVCSAVCTSCTQFFEHLDQTCRAMAVKEELQRTQFLISEDSLQHSGEYHAKLQVLKELNYVDQHGTLQMKGKVACEMGNHELMITELVFHNVLTELQPAEIAALLSCLVFQQKNASAPKMTPVLEEGRDKIRDIAEKIGRTQQLCGLKDVVGDFVDQFRFELTEVVHEWAKGVPFAQLMELTDVQEGMIVRCIQRLDETLRDVRDAARIIGDPILYQKMGEASTAIKRDIVFAASLYTS